MSQGAGSGVELGGQLGGNPNPIHLGGSSQVEVIEVEESAEFGNWLRAKVLPRRAERLAAA